MYTFIPSNSCCRISDVTGINYKLESYSDFEKAHIIFLKKNKLTNIIVYKPFNGFPEIKYSNRFCETGYCKFSYEESQFYAIKDTFHNGNKKYILIQKSQLNDAN